MKDLQEKNAEVRFNKALNCLQVRLSGFIPYNDLVRVLTYEFEMIRYYKLTQCIVDLREIGVYAPQGKEFVKEVWFPQVEQDGVRQIAFLVPENVFGEMSMKKAHERVNHHQKLEVRYFMDQETAAIWLQAVNQLASV